MIKSPGRVERYCRTHGDIPKVKDDWFATSGPDVATLAGLARTTLAFVVIVDDEFGRLGKASWKTLAALLSPSFLEECIDLPTC